MSIWERTSQDERRNFFMHIGTIQHYQAWRLGGDEWVWHERDSRIYIIDRPWMWGRSEQVSDTVWREDTFRTMGTIHRSRAWQGRAFRENFDTDKCASILCSIQRCRLWVWRYWQIRRSSRRDWRVEIWWGPFACWRYWRARWLSWYGFITEVIMLR